MAAAKKAAPKALKLPSIATRKDEVERIVALLEQPHESAEKAARAVLAAAFGLMAERSWYVVANKIAPDAPMLLFGLFATETAAEKAVQSNALALVGAASVHPVTGIQDRADAIEKWEAEVEHPCDACGHPPAAHEWPLPPRKGGKNKGQTYETCVAGKCSCAEYVRPISDIPELRAN